MKKFSSKITVYSVRDKVSEFWLFVKEFPVAAVLNPSLKSRLISDFSRLSRIKNLANEKLKKFKI